MLPPVLLLVIASSLPLHTLAQGSYDDRPHVLPAHVIHPLHQAYPHQLPTAAPVPYQRPQPPHYQHHEPQYQPREQPQYQPHEQPQYQPESPKYQPHHSPPPPPHPLPSHPLPTSYPPPSSPQPHPSYPPSIPYHPPTSAPAEQDEDVPSMTHGNNHGQHELHHSPQLNLAASYAHMASQPPANLAPPVHHVPGPVNPQEESHHSTSSHYHSEHHSVPSKSSMYQNQDTYGNYGFGYETHTMKGDRNYRYEKKSGAKTMGGYGYKTDGGKVEAHFFRHPNDHNLHGAHVHNAPPVGEHVPIPHPPPNPSPYEVSHSPPATVHVPHIPEIPYADSAPVHDIPSVTDNHLHTDQDENRLYHHPRHHSRYDSPFYDRESGGNPPPRVMYAHGGDELLGHAESFNRPTSSNHHQQNQDPLLMQDAFHALERNPFTAQYLNLVDQLVPSGFEARIGQVYRDRKKKK